MSVTNGRWRFFLTCLPGGLCCEVGRKLLEDVGHLLLHEEADEVGGRVELQWQRAGESAPPLLDGGLEGLAEGFYFVVRTLFSRRKRESRDFQTWIMCCLPESVFI